MAYVYGNTKKYLQKKKIPKIKLAKKKKKNFKLAKSKFKLAKKKKKKFKLANKNLGLQICQILFAWMKILCSQYFSQI
jgi:DNA topoisomerase VI subunit A